MSIRIRFALLVLAVVLVLAAAGVALWRAAIPVGQASPSVPPTYPTSPPPVAPPPTGLATIDACDLLTAEEATSLGVPPQGRPDEIVGLRRCDWGTEEGGPSTTINEDLGIDGLVLTDASSVTDITIGRHQAKRAVETSGPGYCSVYFAIGDTANVSVTALYLNDTPRACSVADRAAALIEPKLPSDG